MSKFMKKACLLSSFFSSIKSYTFLRQVPLFVLPVEHEAKKNHARKSVKSGRHPTETDKGVAN